MIPKRQTALIIGAGPAGLTASFEFLKRTGIQPIVLEKSEYMGGIGDGPDPDQSDRVMLVRTRKSRIYFLRKFFDYPVKFSPRTIGNLGISLTFLAGLSYLKSMVAPIAPEENLEQFFINRFGRRFYLLFFKSYTEKVWGVPCNEISAEWGAQRIQGLSLSKALGHFLKSQSTCSDDILQKDVETSLIERFLYPKLDPGQLWEFVAASILEKGGQIHCGWDVQKVHREGDRITGVEALHLPTGERKTFTADYYFSTMPIKDLLHGMDGVPAEVREISDGLQYRDFITVGVLLNKLKISDDTQRGEQLLSDNWIYVQEPDGLVGRIQIFNNWSPYMVKDPNQVWIGLEYFCYDTDPIWSFPDQKMIYLPKEELERMGMADGREVLDATVIRMPKTYPAYFGTYRHFDRIRDYVDKIENLFLIGRNGMHRYNNQDHSMLTAMMAVDNIAAGITDKSNLWEVNAEMEYHEAQKA